MLEILGADRERADPLAGEGGQLEHAPVARRLAQERAPVLVGVFPCQMRQLVDEALER